ncbi:MAG: PAS domain S-box protein [Candidatus Margulisbacteria bacterium]|nr:PAS domain S-box protein [Candidatus Margulisiibacteriota bacterium]
MIKMPDKEPKTTEEALRKREEEFRLIFENAKDAIFWADPKKGIIINCNKAAERLLEKKREEIIGHHQKDLHPPQKAKFYADMFKKHVEERGAIDEEAEIITRSGKIKPVHISASITTVAGKPIIQGIFRDISSYKKAENALKESEERYRNLFEQVNDMIIVFDTMDIDIRIIDLNQKWREVTGYSRSDLPINISNIFNHNDMARFTARTKDLLIAKKIPPEEYALKKKSGESIPAELTATLIEKEGRPAEILVVVRDITERKTREEEMKKHAAELEKMNKFMVGRELDMIELKKEINSLLKELGRPERYKPPDED